MQPRKRAAGAALVAVITGAMLTATQASAAPTSATPTSAAWPAQATAGAAVTVTLINGDRVTVIDDNQTVVERGKGREGIQFISMEEGGHLRVIPTDALPGLRSGGLDPRLFDITQLIEFEYDDARSPDVPLIITGGAALTALGANAAAATSHTVAVPGGTALHAAKSTVETLWQSLSGAGNGVRSAAHTRVWPDGKRQVSLKERASRRLGPRPPRRPGTPAPG